MLALAQSAKSDLRWGGVVVRTLRPTPPLVTGDPTLNFKIALPVDGVEIA